MPVIELIGRVFPITFKLTLNTDRIQQMTHESGLEMWFSVQITKGEIRTQCHCNRFGPGDLVLIWVAGFRMTRGLIDAAAFSLGQGVSVWMDKYVDLQGVEQQLTFEDPDLAPLCTSFRLNPETKEEARNTQSVMVMVMQDVPLSFALNDLVASQYLPPDYGLISCGRAIETIRNSISNNDRKLGWQMMRDALNLGESYLTYITDNSKGPRHGDYSQPTGPEAREVSHRAWIIVNRYIEYRKRGSIPLPLAEFPSLTL